MLQAGEPRAEVKLLDVTDTGTLDGHGQARAGLVRARLTFITTRGSEAPQLLLHAAQQLSRFDAGAARVTYLDAIRAAFFAGARAAPGGTMTEVARAAGPGAGDRRRRQG